MYLACVVEILINQAQLAVAEKCTNFISAEG